MSQIETCPKRVIIVEDDSDLRDCIIKYLQLKGYEVTGVGSAMDFYLAVSATPYAVAILDLSLPDQDGFILARYVRDNTEMRILMLTARTKIVDRLAGYESGADLYLVKPVDFRELAAALDNLFDRISPEHSLFPVSSEHSDGLVWRLDRNDWRLYPPDESRIDLTGKEYQFLCLLAEQPGQILSREELIKALEYPFNESGSCALGALIYRLRKKISMQMETPIKTASGSGYSFSAPLVLI